MKQLWAPWRLEYIKSADDETGCVFCAAVDGDDAEKLVVHRDQRSIVLLNKFPYSSGHFMAAPVRHVGEYGELNDDEVLELHRLASAGMSALGELYGPQGYNLGWNLGRVAGAGIVDHVHLHVVPRWGGDTNFMPVVGHTKVLPQLLGQTLQALRATWPTD